MNITCLKNPDHKEFRTCATIMQDWKIDDKSNFLEVLDESVQTVHGPTIGNIFTCCTCGAEAEATNDD